MHWISVLHPPCTEMELGILRIHKPVEMQHLGFINTANGRKVRERDRITTVAPSSNKSCSEGKGL